MKLTVLDIGGTDIKYSVMDESLNRTMEGKRPTPTESQDALLGAIKEIYCSIGEGCEGIAVSMPGMIDSDAGYCRTGGMLAYNQDTFVAKRIEALCGCPAHIDNDGKCAAWAEYTAGSLRGCQNAAVFIIGTGVGGGLIIDGQLVRGKHFSAGEFSFLCRGLSEWGTLEGMVGFSDATTGLLAMLRKEKALSDDQPLDGKIAFDWIRSGDEVSNRVLRSFTRSIAYEIYNLQMLLDIERIAIGGGISREDLLIDSIRDSYVRLINEEAYPGLHGLVAPTCEIVRCSFGAEANQIGAFESYRTWRENNRK